MLDLNDGNILKMAVREEAFMYVRFFVFKNFKKTQILQRSSAVK